jgi:hypothetical protein
LGCDVVENKPIYSFGIASKKKCGPLLAQIGKSVLDENAPQIQRRRGILGDSSGAVDSCRER